MKHHHRLVLGLSLGLALAVVHPAFAATRVVAEPDRQVRPGTAIDAWGAAGNGGNLGNGSANGEAYEWSFSANPNVNVADDGNLSGNVANDKFINEQVTFTLSGGSTRELITGTLTVGGTSSTVAFDIVANNDPISNSPLEKLQVDVNIAISEGLEYLYLQQQADGHWNGYSSQNGATTAFALWAFQNSGHLPTNDPNDDVYTDGVVRGLDYLEGTATDQGTFAEQADVPREATADQVSDLNENDKSVKLASSDSWWGYSHAIGAAAFIASLDTASYQTLVEDAIDFIGFTQTPNDGFGGTGRGGWEYNGPGDGSDNSINSWNWVALEGGETTPFGIDAPDWILQESEHTLVSHQTNAAGGQPYGYTSPTPLLGNDHGHATTCAGVSGLAAATFEDAVPVGDVIDDEPGPLDSIADRRASAIDYLGQKWHIDSNGGLGHGNRGNFYAMWTCCRAFRLTQGVTGNHVILENDGVNFDWETGEENNSGNVAGPDDPQEGYSPWLVRHQNADGSWSEGTYIQEPLETSLAVLCLNPTVFGPPPETPVFDHPPTPQCGTTYNVEPGDSVSFTVQASHEDAGVDVTLDVTGLPSGATMTPPLPATGNPVSSQFDWTTSGADANTSTLLTFTAETEENGDAEPCSIRIDVARELLVSLSSFQATAKDRQVTLTWTTEAELDNAGFYLLRREIVSGREERLGSGLIGAQGDVNQGASYEFLDARAVNGVQYEYVLVDVDRNGFETRHPGVMAVANPDNPRIRLLSPGYGSAIQAGSRTTFRWQSDRTRSNATLVISADPSFSGGEALTLTAVTGLDGSGHRTLTPAQSRSLDRMAATSHGVVYWKVVESGVSSSTYSLFASGAGSGPDRVRRVIPVRRGR